MKLRSRSGADCGAHNTAQFRGGLSDHDRSATGLHHPMLSREYVQDCLRISADMPLSFFKLVGVHSCERGDPAHVPQHRVDPGDRHDIVPGLRQGPAAGRGLLIRRRRHGARIRSRAVPDHCGVRLPGQDHTIASSQPCRRSYVCFRGDRGSSLFCLAMHCTLTDAP